MHKFRIALVALLFTCTGFTQIEEVRRITQTLCTPEFHGRGYVQKGDSIAAAFLIEEFKKINVGPFNGTYLQPFKLDVNTFPSKMIVSQNGVELIPGKDFIIHPSATGGIAKYDLLELTASELLDLDNIRDVIRKVKMDVNASTALLIDYTIMHEDSIKKVKEIAMEIATLLPVIQVVDTKFTWSVGREQAFYPFFEIQSNAIDKTMPLSIDVDAKMIQNYESQNVMAYIPSKKKCAKTVMFTAHYDHLGRMGSNTFFPGANDNASGTAMLLTMAKYFEAHPLKYNVLFVAFAGEEAGLVGSKHFVENSPLKLKKIRFLFNLDIMGSGEEGITIVNATLFEKEFQLLQDINTEKELLTQVKSRGPAANSDHYWFTEKGVPAFFMYTMGPNKHYHDIFDEYEELSFEEYHDITTLLIEFVQRLKK